MPTEQSDISQLLPTEQPADALAHGQVFLPDRAVSDADDPDLGAAALEDDATGGGDGAGGSGGGGGLEAWSDDDAEEAGQRRQPAGNRARASSSVAPSAPSGAPKRRAGTQLHGARPKKPKGSAVVARREEAATKAIRFQRAMKQPSVVHA